MRGVSAEAVNQDSTTCCSRNVGHRIPEVAHAADSFVSNVVYNFNYFARNRRWRCRWISSTTNMWLEMKRGNSNPHPVNVNSSLGTNCLAHCELNGVAPSIHMSGNVGPQGTDYEIELARRTSEGGGEGACPIRGSWQRSSPLPAENVSHHCGCGFESRQRSTADGWQLADLDCGWRRSRDETHKTLESSNQLQDAGSGACFTGQFTPVGAWSGQLDVVHRVVHDGLPDQWKTAKGLSTSDS